MYMKDICNEQQGEKNYDNGTKKVLDLKDVNKSDSFPHCPSDWTIESYKGEIGMKDQLFCMTFKQMQKVLLNDS